MQLWQRRGLGVLALGGSFLGLSLAVQQLFNPLPALSKVLMLPFIGLYAWGIWCGLALIEGADGALRSNRRFWAVQVPVFSSPLISYMFSSGCLLAISFQPVEGKFNLAARFGSQLAYSLMEPTAPWGLGINVFAVGMWFLLTRCIRGQQTQWSLASDGTLGPAPSN